MIAEALAWYFFVSILIMIFIACDSNDAALERVVNGPFGQQIFFIVLVVFFGPISLVSVLCRKLLKACERGK